MDKKKLNLGKGRKQVLHVTIDQINMDMLKEVQEGYDDSLANSVNEVLDFFRLEIWDTHKIPRTTKEAKDWEKKKEEANKK